MGWGEVVADGAALKVKQLLQPVFAPGGGGKAESKVGGAGLHDGLEAGGGNMVVFVDDDVGVRREEGFGVRRAGEGLQHAEGDGGGGGAFGSAEAMDVARGEVEKGGEAFAPLFEEGGAVNEDEGFDAASGDEGAGHDGFSRARRGDEHAVGVREEGVEGGLLRRRERTVEGEREGSGGRALVGDAEKAAGAAEELLGVGDHAAREDEAVGVAFAGEEEARGLVSGEAKALFFVEDGVGESSEAFERGDQAGGQGGLRSGGVGGDDELGGAYGVVGMWIQVACDAGGEKVEGGFVGLELDVFGGVVGCCFGGRGWGARLWWSRAIKDGLEGVAVETGEGGEVGPLVGYGLKVVVEEDAVAVVASGFLEGQGNEVTEAAGGEGVLVGEEAIIGVEAERGVEDGGVGEEVGAEAAGEGGGHGFGEKEPGVAAVPGAGAFGGDGEAEVGGGAAVGGEVVAPAGAVEICGEEGAGVVGADGVGAEGVSSGEVVAHGVSVERREGLVGTVGAFDPGLFADIANPFVAAGRGVACATGLGVFPAARIDVGTAGEKGEEEGDFLLGVEGRGVGGGG